VIVRLPECLQQASQSVASFHSGVSIEVQINFELLHIQAPPGDINAYQIIVANPVALV
jgi:hypothetical protein